MNSQLLCTFATTDTLETTLEQIQNTYRIVYNYIYVLQDTENYDDLFITYNIDSDYAVQIAVVNTILLHRKKHTNTLYTINALNQLVREENNGILDKRFMIDWQKFKNTIILTNGGETRKISTRIHSILELN